MIEDDNLMKFISNATRVEIKVFFVFEDETWNDTKDIIQDWCNEALDGEAVVMLTREDDLTDEYVWFSVFCENEDEAREVVKTWDEQED